MDYKISKHALERYLQRKFGLSRSQVSEEDASRMAETMASAIANGSEIKLSPREAICRLIKYRYVEARYVYGNSMVFVVCRSTCVTCYYANANYKRKLK